MAKSGGVRLTTHVLLVFAVASYFVATFGDGREIERVKTHAARLAAERDSIHQVVDWLSRQQHVLRESARRHASRATRLRDSVVTLEQLRQEARFTVRRLRKTEDLQARLDQVFPEMADSRWGLTTIPLNEADTLGIEYFVVPVWFTETFLIDHQDAMYWREQNRRLVELDSLNGQVVALRDSVTQLELEKSRAFQAGYHEAYRSYQNQTQRYLAQLKKPRLSLGSTLGLCLGAAGVGVLVGSVVQ